VCSREAGEEGERLVRGREKWRASQVLIGNDTNLVEGGKKEDLSGLRKGQQERCGESFGELMGWEDASP
jgi:hypothetical protein